MNYRPLHITLLALGLVHISGCVNSTQGIEQISHKGYCTDQFNRPLNEMECSKKATEEIHGKQQKPESARLIEGVNKSLEEKKKPE
jgi:hypothetical protein